MNEDGRHDEKAEGGDHGEWVCPLPDADQTRNILIYSVNWGLIYLASPVTYVGVVQATLIDRLGFSNSEANLPASAYLWSMPLAVLVIWLFPQVRALRPMLITALASAAVMGGLVAFAVTAMSPRAILTALVAYAVVWGCGNGVIATCQWEMIGRGVSASRRGQALALAFGAGPILAVIASLGSQLIMGGDAKVPGFLAWMPRPGYPWNFATLYLASVLVLGAAAIQSWFFIVPRPVAEVRRQPFVSGVFGGFLDYLGSRPIFFAAIAYIMVYSGHEILQNLSLYTREVLGESPDSYAGLLLALRFGFKVAAGFFLGWLLVKTDPRTLLLATAGLTFLAVLWGAVVPGWWFLLASGILGAGELFGVYYPNYILDCSPRSQIRRNMVFTNMITMLVGFAPVVYGWISDTFGEDDKKFGFRVSFAVSLAVLAATMILVRLTLPARPRPSESPSTFQENTVGESQAA
ncbi:MAG: MFS transporter [Isosphaeraceae bacterium]